VASPLTVHLFGLSDIGNHRHTNEDAWWAGQLEGAFSSSERPGGAASFRCAGAPVVAIVSDGVGGANAGEVASQMAIACIPAALAAHQSALADTHTARQTVRAALGAAHAAIKDRAVQPGLGGMCATVSLLCLAGPNLAWWGQAGDSRVYLFRAGKLTQITPDHSPVGRMRREGWITEAEARRHPQRNQIDQSLGDPLNPFLPEVGSLAVQPADIFLLCSDGLSDGLWEHDLAQALSRVHHAADVQPLTEELVASAKRASGRDNITAVLLLIEPDDTVAARLA
jgi:protein phosphatase